MLYLVIQLIIIIKNNKIENTLLLAEIVIICKKWKNRNVIIIYIEKIWPFDDESGVPSNEVVITEYEETGGPLSSTGRLWAFSFSHIACFGYSRSLCAITVI